MFDGGRNACIFIPTDGGFDKFHDGIGIVAEGTDADFGIQRVDVHIAHRVIELGDSHGSHLPSHQVGNFIGQVHIPYGSNAHRRDKLQNTPRGIVVFEITFHINGHMKRNSGRPLHGDFLKVIKGFGEFFGGNTDPKST